MPELTPQARVIEGMFRIQNKQGTSVDFKLNPSQRAYDVVRTKRDAIPKARQKGFSTLGIAYQLVDCLTIEGTRAVLISHEATATRRLLDRATYYLENIKGPDAQLGRHSRNEISFPKTGSTYFIGTAGAKSFGRGDTITHLHISEYAWWESDALEKVAGLFQAVPMTGTIRIESTGNGRNNDFYYVCKNADKLDINIFFRSWWEDDEYSRPPKEGWFPEGYEHYFQDLKTDYNLSENQLYWYWLKLLEFRSDLKYMQQEYPSKLEECFQASSGALFSDIKKTDSSNWKWSAWQGRRKEFLDNHPLPESKATYVIGADPSGGTGNDEAGIQIFQMETLEQVFEFSSDRIDPVELGHYLVELGNEYNEAWIVCENNNHGIATHSILKSKYNRRKLYKKLIPTKGEIKYGFYTGEAGKQEIIGAIREYFDMGLMLHGPRTISQLTDFEEDEHGKMGADEDGLVLSLGMACIGLLKYKRYAFIIEEDEQEEVDRTAAFNQNFMYFTFDDIIKHSRFGVPRYLR